MHALCDYMSFCCATSWCCKIWLNQHPLWMAKYWAGHVVPLPFVKWLFKKTKNKDAPDSKVCIRLSGCGRIMELERLTNRKADWASCPYIAIHQNNGENVSHFLTAPVISCAFTQGRLDATLQEVCGCGFKDTICSIRWVFIWAISYCIQRFCSRMNKNDWNSKSEHTFWHEILSHCFVFLLFGSALFCFDIFLLRTAFSKHSRCLQCMLCYNLPLTSMFVRPTCFKRYIERHRGKRLAWSCSKGPVLTAILLTLVSSSTGCTGL